jgi:hypothetical protein
MQNVQYRNERRAANKKFYKVLKLWKAKLPVDVWKNVSEHAMQLFMDEWDAKGRALGLLTMLTCAFCLHIF